MNYELEANLNDTQSTETFVLMNRKFITHYLTTNIHFFYK